MSYTAPQYVDTKEQAILALASVIADEDKGALGDGSVNRALDVLADVLAESDVQVPQTDAGAILALADYVSGGGGGSSDFTTAHVTVVDSSGGKTGGIDGLACHVCTFATLEGISATFQAPMWAQGSSVEFDAVLYKGGAYFEYADEQSEVESVSGSATKMGEKTVLITGDCTITISLG